MGEPLDVLALGDFAWDVLIHTDAPLAPGGDTFGQVELQPGGSAANVAVWARRCGARAGFVGKIGRDRFGELARENLDEEGVEHRLSETSSRPTGVVAVWVDHTGQRSMVSGQGADFLLTPADLPPELEAARHLHLTGWSLFTDPPRRAALAAARRAKGAGRTLSLDPASFQLIEETGPAAFVRMTAGLGLDVVFPNYDEGRVLTGEREPEAMARRLSALYPGAVVALKLDAKGALVGAGDRFTYLPPTPDQATDATGAGDAFAGAFLARWTRGQGPEEAARFAVVVSGWVVARRGARPPLDARMKEHCGVS
ncbi:carbohydrate kinase family protein [Oceanithermus profundus]|uniref:PfkB domain protein n=1 Tax=Oceanithermus profundus (strain DSM 14977 / NBRC 100410 / VKM B-2274 / 506) TaxID=670487 RepID=E4U5C4_OCEP5|nr:carbohydrate kinase family protein [Oceanithermus profundus]ADR37598.1 PfkB domain protein [Oceanithermus profundus DSM 14977]